MRFEDLKYDFPKMPEEMRTMIEREVNKQIKTEQPQVKKSRKTASRTLAASVAAVMLLSTTAFAGVSIYRMQRQQVSDHGVAVKIADNTGKASQAKTADAIPNVKMELGYLPDGMVQTGDGKYSYKDALHQGGVSICFYRMDTGDGQFELLHDDVLSSEDLTMNGRQGVYLEYPQLYEDEITFNQRIYAAFTDVHYVMEMFAASDVKKEDAIKIADSIKLIPTEDAGDKKLINAWNWSDYLASRQEQLQNDQTQDAGRVTAAKEDMKHTHAIGESFAIDRTLMAKVSNVQVSDDLSLLKSSLVDENFKNETDKNGKLRPATIQYIKDGDMDTLSEVVKSREVAQKLVVATVEYTNTGENELSDVLFMGTLARIREDGGQMRMSSGYNYEEPSDKDEWTYAVNRGLSNFCEMPYYDVHSGEQNNNYIANIKPGETVTVHMAWIVTQEELEKLYLNLDTAGGAYEFSDSALATGYVDIRQL